MNGSEANLGGSEFSDSSSSVSIEDLPPSAFSAHSPAGLLTVVTPHTGSNGLDNTLLADETSMVTLMEASDCDDITGFNFNFPKLEPPLSKCNKYFVKRYLHRKLLRLKY